MLYKSWNIHTPDAQKSAALAKAVGAGRLLSDVLVARGHDTPESARALLRQDVPLPDPFSMSDMEKAVERIHRALAQEEPIAIYGDYDVDGITATALLYNYLESQGAEVYYKLPSRSDDEYGLTPLVVEQVVAKGIGLIITVDNGTTAFPAAARAAELGVDIVMTDHHLPQDTLPGVAALVNPCRADDESGCECLSGVGVAFMLACALEGCPPEELLPIFSDLVAIGTVADVMRLCGPNRTLVKSGLQTIQSTARPGLVALIENCSLNEKDITVENISYVIAPRLNAAGRMDDATLALRLLLTESPEEAALLVEVLQEQNLARQKAEQEMVAEIIEQVDQDPALQQARVLVVWGENWHQGVVGIVSSRLVDKYAKPAITITIDGDEGKGSGRSVHGFSLHGAIASCEDILIRFGGHDLAAGLSIQRANLPEFRRRVNEWAKRQVEVPAAPEIEVDAPLDLQALDVAGVEDLDRLAPCGSGNPSPHFLLAGAQIEAVYPVSEGRHSRLRLRKDEGALYAVLFGAGPETLAYKQGDIVDLVLVLSVYRGKYEPQVSARVLEMRPAGLSNEHVGQNTVFESFACGGALPQSSQRLLAPSRDDTSAVYRALRDGTAFYYDDLRPVFSQLGEQSTGRILASLAALEELGLVRRNEQTGRYEIVQVSGKRDLADSLVLQKLGVRP